MSGALLKSFFICTDCLTLHTRETLRNGTNELTAIYLSIGPTPADRALLVAQLRGAADAVERAVGEN